MAQQSVHSTESALEKLDSLTVKWSGKEYVIDDLHATATVYELRARLHLATGVAPHRQKLINLKHKGKIAEDSVQISAVGLKAGTKIMMVGSLEQDIQSLAQASQEQDAASVLDDFDLPEEVAFESREVYLEKINKRVATYEIKVMNEPRPGKKCLVLDIDYTLFDHRSVAECGNELMRPYLHEFLTAVYEHYDIVIWSATSMKWIVEKMKLLGVSSNPSYKIMFYLDSNAMVSVHSEHYGVVEVKPLGVIWGKYPQYGPHNTLIIDDLRRNFLLNPRNGIKIKAFRKAHLSRDTDRELVFLAEFLVRIIAEEDYSLLELGDWNEDSRKHKKRR